MISLIFGVVSAQTSLYGPCNPTNHRYASVQGRGFPITPALSNGLVTITGEFYIIDGCRFGLRDFVYYGGGETYWFAGNRGSSDGITFSDTYVHASAFPANFTFELVQRPGAQANFNGINQLRLFERNRNVVVATVDLPDTPAPSGTAPVPSGGGSSASPSPSTGSNSKNSAFQTATTIATISSVFLAFFFI